VLLALTVPIWYSYAPGGEVRVLTGKTSRKAQLLSRAHRFSLCAQNDDEARTRELPRRSARGNHQYHRSGTRTPPVAVERLAHLRWGHRRVVGQHEISPYPAFTRGGHCAFRSIEIERPFWS
jgi:hypothetical protein